MAGVKPRTITRIIAGPSLPRVDTIIKLLLPLGKTLEVVPLKKSLAEYEAKTMEEKYKKRQ